MWDQEYDPWDYIENTACLFQLVLMLATLQTEFDDESLSKIEAVGARVAEARPMSELRFGRYRLPIWAKCRGTLKAR